MAESDWWVEDWQTLPKERTRLKSVAAREFNFQFAGDPENLTQTLAVHGWRKAQPANWSWSILSLNPEPSEFTLPPLKRDYLGHADSLLLHRLGGDPLAQETLRIWDSGIRLKPSGQAVYLGLVANEALVQRMAVFSYWSASPASTGNLDELAGELGKMQLERPTDSMLLIRD